MTYLPYAGIGSRETPEAILRLMYRIGATLARNGFTLRSGGAQEALLALTQPLKKEPSASNTETLRVVLQQGQKSSCLGKTSMEGNMELFLFRMNWNQKQETLLPNIIRIGMPALKEQSFSISET